MHLVTPEPAPLGIVGPPASAAATTLLDGDGPARASCSSPASRAGS
jgi:hypothetical protein